MCIVGVFKKLETSGKKKKCKQVADWARSVSNHLYWCAASSDGDGEMVSEKWLSILNHITNVHEGHGERFPKCLHGELEDRDWIKKVKYIVPKFLYELLVFEYVYKSSHSQLFLEMISFFPFFRKFSFPRNGESCSG